MKKILISMLLMLAVVGCATLGLKKSTLKPYKTSKLENGLHILYVNDEKLPYISLSLITMSGFAKDPKDQTGLTSAVFGLLDKGTQTKSAEQVSREIEQMGAEYDANVTADYSMVSLDGLAWQEDELLSMFSELIQKPKFDDQEIARYKAKSISLISQRLDQIAYVASESFDSYYYKNHPYAQRDLGTVDHLQKLNKIAVTSYYSKMLRPNNSWLVVVGKYSSDVERKIAKYFGEWRSAPLEDVQFPPIEEIQGRNILLVENSDAAQTEIRIGHRGPARTAPEHVANTIANSILGQGFTSRLVDRIRDQLGLTYSISSSTDYKLHGSVFEIRTFTQNPKVGKTVSEIYKVYEEFATKGVTPTELDVAKKYMIGVFPSLVETAEKVAHNLMVLRLFGVSDDYLLNYQDNIAKVTLADVNAAIKKNFDPANLKIVVVGPKGKILPQVKGLGKVKTVKAKDILK